MGYQVYRIGNGRWGGYGVPAYCEHPDCNEEIDRGMAFACGEEPFMTELGCDRYFCSKHRLAKGWDAEKEEWCLHTEDCNCEYKEICERCANVEAPFPYKEEHPDWTKHILTHESWEEWRKENPEEVKKRTMKCKWCYKYNAIRHTKCAFPHFVIKLVGIYREIIKRNA